MASRRQFCKAIGAGAISACFSPTLLASSSHSIKIIGIGGAGCNIARSIRRQLECLVGATVVTVDRSVGPRASTGLQADVYVATGYRWSPQFYGGEVFEWYDAEAPSRPSPDDMALIHAVVEGAQRAIIIAGLGGLTGTSLVPLFALVAKESGARTDAVLTLPFEFEGRRVQNAQAGAAQVSGIADRVVLLDNESMLEELDVEVSMADAFRESRRRVSMVVAGRVVDLN